MIGLEETTLARTSPRPNIESVQRMLKGEDVEWNIAGTDASQSRLVEFRSSASVGNEMKMPNGGLVLLNQGEVTTIATAKWRVDLAPTEAKGRRGGPCTLKDQA